MNKKVTICFLDYDENPPDLENAMSVVRVEIGNPPSTADYYDEAFDVVVCTPGYIKEQVKQKESWLTGPLLIVDRFDLDRVTEFIESSLEQIKNMHPSV